MINHKYTNTTTIMMIIRCSRYRCQISFMFTIRNRHADMLHVFRESRVEWSTVQIWAQITTGLREKKSTESHGYSFSRLSLGRQIPVKMPDLYSISACVSESRYIGCPEVSHQSLLPNMGQFVLQFMAMWIGKMMINRWISVFFCSTLV